MGKILLVRRLAARDLRYHKAQAMLLLLAITAATAVLTLGLVLHGVTSQPYQQTQAATNGPDLVAQLDPVTVSGPAGGPTPHKPPSVTAQARQLSRLPGVTRASGPYPVASALVDRKSVV